MKRSVSSVCVAIIAMVAMSHDIKGEIRSVTIPSRAELVIGVKSHHYTDFSVVEPMSVAEDGDVKVYTYSLDSGTTYNYRTYMPGGITQAGKGVPESFSEESYMSYDPAMVNHDPKSNRGYETGDIFLNINSNGHLSLNVGDTFSAHAMRSWQLTDHMVNNYFIEPDFHYTVVDSEGRPSTDVIEIEHTPGSAWADIKAVGKGTVIVTVTYDAILLQDNWMGGAFWGAIWPENTGVFVVTVGEESADFDSSMYINEAYNENAKKLSGGYIDAEHDILYYLDSEEGAAYSFTPEGVTEVSLAYPHIDDCKSTYTGFDREGVQLNNDGSYTLLFKEGRNIVRLRDNSGRYAYQVVTAKSCHREISNLTRPGAVDFRAGDEIEIQYSGLYHPASKLAGVYNMSAYVTYNGNPNGTSLVMGSGQYTFGSSAKAQALTVKIGEEYEADGRREFVLDEGVIQINGYGDPIGNHRTMDRFEGRDANIAAVAQKTCLGRLPDVRIPLATSGVDTLGADDVTKGKKIFYNLQGVPSTHPYKGVNIVRTPDGKVYKINHADR